MSRTEENTGFVCVHCAAAVPPAGYGRYRNHCPVCLWSRHVDDRPGDRASDCGAAMAPLGLIDKSGKGWQILHECAACGHRHPTRVIRDGAAPDDLDLLLELPWL